ncbi:MAG: DNA repair protein RadA, partial [Methanoregulaceae archaeon]|nr:DNA repair protein RadA [Methanoregulaceae archaeon]
MPESAQQRMSTGISSLDPILDGGVPPGSVILLLGD